MIIPILSTETSKRMAVSDGGNSLKSDIDSVSFGLDAEDERALQDNDIQTTFPAQIFRLQYVSAACLVINTMIGELWDLDGPFPPAQH